MSIGFIITDGIGLAPGSVKYLITLGYIPGAVINKNDTHDGADPIRRVKDANRKRWEERLEEQKELSRQIRGIIEPDAILPETTIDEIIASSIQNDRLLDEYSEIKTLNLEAIAADIKQRLDLIAELKYKEIEEDDAEVIYLLMH